MKPAAFEYHDPSSIDDVVDLLAEHGDTAKVLAGGQSLVPLLAMRLARFEHLVDINDVEDMAAIEEIDGAVRIGAMARQSAVGSDPVVARSVPLLTLATPHIGHFQVRNRGTLGGSLAHSDPAAEYPTVAVALDAELNLRSARGQRTVAAADFFQGAFWTAVEDDELLVDIEFPIWTGRSGFAFEEVSRRHGDFALVGAAVAVTLDGVGVVMRVAITLLGVEARPVRASGAESAMLGVAVDAVDPTAIGQLALADRQPMEDLHASTSYRRSVGEHIVAAAVTNAVHRALHGAEHVA